MERRKTKIFGICTSIVLVLSIVLALFCVFNLGALSGGNVNNSDNSATTVATYDKDKYLGGVGDLNEYMELKGYRDKTETWKAISSEQNLKDFLSQTNGYAGFHGYLTCDIDLAWSSDRAYLAPNILLEKNLDGCGFNIRLKKEANGVELDRRSDSQVGYNLRKEGDGYGMKEGEDSLGAPIYYKVDFHCFGGLVSVLGEKAVLSNFTFTIEDHHYFGYKDSSNNDYNDSGEDALAVVGGLVGYNQGGTIDNVVVNLANGKKFGAYEDVSSRGNSISKFGCTNAVYLGLVAGASKGGKISNTSSIFSANSTLQTTNRTGWIRKWNLTQPKSHAGASFVGGIAGYIMGGTTIDHAYAEFNNGCRLTAEVNKARYNDAGGSNGDYKAYRKIGGIVAINKGGQVNTAMVSGNLDCMVTGGNSTGGDEGVEQAKNIYVAEGTEPGTKLYKNASGGTETAGGDNASGSGYNQGYTKVNFASLNTKSANNGYGGKEIPFFFDHDTNNAVKIFIPDGYILWNLYGQAVFSQLISGQYSASKFPAEGSSSDIQIGINSTGEIGFYKQDQVNGTEILAVDDGTRWIEMSDQSRAARNGNKDKPLYYDGTKYQLMMKINGRLYSKGVRVINVGDLKNAMNTFNGRPVKLYCDDGGDYDNAVAYSEDSEKIVIMLKNVTVGMERVLSIQKRSLLVETDEDYVRGETTIFGGAYVKFTRLSDDKNGEKSGFANGDLMMWQDQGYAENTPIYLNVAGRQLLRPSTNNYVLYKEVIFGQQTRLEEVGSYFSAIIAPHTIQVHESIYINGAAVDGVNSRTRYGSYSIMSNKDFGDADKNAEKRTITITGRLNDGHFGAKAIALYDKNGNELQNITWTTTPDGLTTTTFTVSDDSLAKIDFVDYYPKKYTIETIGGTVTSQAGVLNEETGKIEYTYGDKVTIKANEPEPGKIFVGWLRADGVTYLNYKTEYSFKINDNYKLTAYYEDIDAAKPWTQIYLDNLGNQIRVRKAVNEAVDANYTLPNVMAWTFREWEEISRDIDNKVVTFKAAFNETANSPKVRVVYDNKTSVLTNYGAPITLEANTTYLVNGTLVETKSDVLTIYAITDLNIEKINKVNFPGVIKKQSMKYTAFLLEGTYYISATFVYGDFNATYNTEDNKPRLGMAGFSKNDVTEYVRQGNVYQISIVVTAQELECRFGNNAEIATFLNILTDEKDEETGDYKKDEFGKDIVKYQFEEIMIFRRKN